MKPQTRLNFVPRRRLFPKLRAPKLHVPKLRVPQLRVPQLPKIKLPSINHRRWVGMTAVILFGVSGFFVGSVSEFPAPEKLAVVSTAVSTPVNAEVTLEPKIERLETPSAEVESIVVMNQENVANVTLRSDSLFESGTAQLSSAAHAVIQQVTERVQKELGAITRIEIEGHTDDTPVRRMKRFFPSNWELSAARAASFIPVLKEFGLVEQALKVVGYGDSRPLVPNRKPSGEVIQENLVKNRRIILKVFGGGAQPDTQ